MERILDFDRVPAAQDFRPRPRARSTGEPQPVSIPPAGGLALPSSRKETAETAADHWAAVGFTGFTTERPKMYVCTGDMYAFVPQSQLGSCVPAAGSRQQCGLTFCGPAEPVQVALDAHSVVESQGACFTGVRPDQHTG